MEGYSFAPVHYTKEDISDMQVILPNDLNSNSFQNVFSQNSFDDHSYTAHSCDYGSMELKSRRSKLASTSIANLLPTATLDNTAFDSDCYFESTSNVLMNRGFSRNEITTTTVPSHFSRSPYSTHKLNYSSSQNNFDYPQHQIVNSHFKIKRTCAAEQSSTSNFVSPVLSSVRQGKIPLTLTAGSPMLLKNLYDKKIAHSSSDLHKSFSFKEYTDIPDKQQDGPPAKTKSSLSRSALRLSRYDNVDDVVESLVTTNSKKVNDKSISAADGNNNSQQLLNASSLNILAKKMFRLEGFSKQDIAIQINKRSNYAQELGKEYLLCFEFKGSTIETSLREFLEKIMLYGETQERERILTLFSRRYYECNPDIFKTFDSCHTITCAIILLNTDHYGQNLNKKMSLRAFLLNLSGLNEGEDFDEELLKGIYSSISKKPLPIDVSSKPVSTSESKTSTVQHSYKSGVNPLLDVPDMSKGMIFKKGYIMRKSCIDADGRKVPFGKRNWRMFFATLCDSVLFLHKDEADSKADANFSSDSLRIHHCLADFPRDYEKKQYVFELKLANWATFLIQTSNEKECNQWMEAINLASACFSAPALPGAIGSQVSFQRPLFPASPTKLSLIEQLQEHDKNAKKFEQELIDHMSCQPQKDARNRVVDNFSEKQTYLQFEQRRYATYVQVLKKNYDRLKNKDRFRQLESSINSSQHGSIIHASNLTPVKSSPTIIFETRV